MIDTLTEKQISDLALKLPNMLEDAKVVIGSSEEQKNIVHIIENIYEAFFDEELYKGLDESTQEFLSTAKIDIERNYFDGELIASRYFDFQYISNLSEEVGNHSNDRKCHALLLNNAIATNIVWYDILKKLNAKREENDVEVLYYLFAKSTLDHDVIEWSYKEAEKGLEQYQAYILRDAGFIFKHNLPISEKAKQVLDQFIKKILAEKKPYFFLLLRKILDR
jgi:hypothetical protein